MRQKTIEWKTLLRCDIQDPDLRSEAFEAAVTVLGAPELLYDYRFSQIVAGRFEPQFKTQLSGLGVQLKELPKKHTTYVIAIEGTLGGAFALRPRGDHYNTVVLLVESMQGRIIPSIYGNYPNVFRRRFERVFGKLPNPDTMLWAIAAIPISTDPNELATEGVLAILPDGGIPACYEDGGGDYDDLARLINPSSRLI